MNDQLLPPRYMVDTPAGSAFHRHVVTEQGCIDSELTVVAAYVQGLLSPHTIRKYLAILGRFSAWFTVTTLRESHTLTPVTAAARFLREVYGCHVRGQSDRWTVTAPPDYSAATIRAVVAALVIWYDALSAYGMLDIRLNPLRRPVPPRTGPSNAAQAYA